MRPFIKLMLLLVVAAVAAPFLLKDPDGRPLMSLEQLRAPAAGLPDLGGAADKLRSALKSGEEEASVPVEVYRWQDAAGVWHFSDSPQAGEAVQKVIVDPNANLVHYDRPASPEIQPRAPAESDASPTIPFPATVPLAKVPKLIQDAKDVGRLQGDRLEHMGQAVSE